MKHFIDALDLSRCSPEHQRLVHDVIVPGLLNDLSENGLDIEVGEQLSDVAKFKSSREKMPLFQPFNPAFQPNATDRDTLTIFAIRNGEPVACIAARLMWVEGTLAQEMQSLRLFYEHPRAMATEGEICLVKSPVGEEIRSCWIALGGGGWVDPSEQGVGLYKILMRLQRLLILTNWRWTYSVALLTEANALKIGRNTLGHYSFAPRVFRVVPGQAMKDREYWLVAAERIEVARTILRPETGDIEIPLNWPSAADMESAKRDAWGNA
jgi:hypothetical protein